MGLCITQSSGMARHWFFPLHHVEHKYFISVDSSLQPSISDKAMATTSPSKLPSQLKSCSSTPFLQLSSALINKKIKFSSHIRKFRMEHLQSHIWLTASSFMGKYLRKSSDIRKPFLIYDFATAPLWISLMKIWFSLLSVYGHWSRCPSGQML